VKQNEGGASARGCPPRLFVQPDGFVTCSSLALTRLRNLLTEHLGQFTTHSKMNTEHSYGLTRERLVDLYVTQGLTDVEIGESLGVRYSAISRLRERWGIRNLLASERLGLPETLTENQQQLLLGTMLGDGRLTGSGSETALLTEYHCLKQSDYLMWKVAQWGSFINRVSDRTNGEYRGKVYCTHASRVFRPYWEMFYPEGKGHKTLKLLDPKRVGPLALAVWYLDDGSKSNTGTFRFSLGPPDPESFEVALGIFRNLGMHPARYGEAGDSTIIVQTRKDITLFAELVSPHIPDCMSYKMELKAKRGGPPPRDLLTPQALQPLIDRDLSAMEMAEIFSVSRNSVGRALDRMGVPHQPTGRPAGKRGFDLGVSEARILKMDPLAPDYRERVLGVLSMTEFPGKEPTTLEARKDIASLKTSPVRVQDGKIVGASKLGQRACLHFFGYRLDGTYRDNLSARRGWYDTETLVRAVNFQITHHDPVTPKRVWRAVQAILRAPCNFRPTIAKALVDAFCPPGGVVLDPCAGYGGRALGTLVTGRTYVGVDPHPKAKEAYHGLFALLGGNATFHHAPYEEVALGDLQADLALTSPPYFSVERYSDATTQSWVRYKTWMLWVNGFLRPLLTKTYQHLKPGALFLLNVKDIRKGKDTYPLVSESRRLAEEAGFVSEPDLSLPLGRLGPKEKSSEPILVLRKPGPGTPRPVERSQPVVATQMAPTVAEPPRPRRYVHPENAASREVVCKGCGVTFTAHRSDREFHSEACYVKYRRRQAREEVPNKTYRTFTCEKCGVSWDTEALGRFTLCEGCRATHTRESTEGKREKTCHYRHCQKTYTDTSRLNGTKFCCAEHQRREKLFKSGQVTSEDQFRDPSKPTYRTCKLCKTQGTEEEILGGVCLLCRAKLREKTCKKCNATYTDASERNTRRYCFACRPDDTLPVTPPLGILHDLD